MNRQPMILWKPVFLNVPQTSTLLALGFFTAIFFWPFFLAFCVRLVPEIYQDEVVNNGKFMRDAMLLILGYYFAKVVNAGQQDITNRAMRMAESNTPLAEADKDQIYADR